MGRLLGLFTGKVMEFIALGLLVTFGVVSTMVMGVLNNIAFELRQIRLALKDKPKPYDYIGEK